MPGLFPEQSEGPLDELTPQLTHTFLYTMQEVVGDHIYLILPPCQQLLSLLLVGLDSGQYVTRVPTVVLPNNLYVNLYKSITIIRKHTSQLFSLQHYIFAHLVRQFLPASVILGLFSNYTPTYLRICSKIGTQTQAHTYVHNFFHT